MKTTPYGEHVRVRTESAKYPGGQDHEVVEELVDGRWQECARFGHMSNDYALSNAAERARSLARKHIGGGH